MTEERTLIRVGSRKSQLALIQSNTIIDKLKEISPRHDFELVTMATLGDKILDCALSKIGTTDLFTGELKSSLEKGEVDFIVHSLKDLSTTSSDKLVIGCVYKRACALDAVVMHPKHKGKKLDDLQENSVIGTCSLRRAAQLMRRYPQHQFMDIRGNLNSRMKKLCDDDKYDAIILAVAGLERMGWQDKIAQVLSPEECMYAVCQGAIAVECRAGDKHVLELLSKLHDQDTALCCIAERAFIKQLECGYSAPVCVYSQITEKKYELTGGIFSLDGKQAVIDSISFEFPAEPKNKKACVPNGHTYTDIVPGHIDMALCQGAENLGKELTKRFMKTEAAEILEVAKEETEKAVREERARKEKQKH